MRYPVLSEHRGVRSSWRVVLTFLRSLYVLYAVDTIILVLDSFPSGRYTRYQRMVVVSIGYGPYEYKNS